MIKSNIDFSIVVKGKEIPKYTSPLDSQIYIEGREGSDYSLRIRNNNYFSVLAIVSVDGLSVTTGEPAGPDSDGYVIKGYQTLDIPGWMVDNSTAAKFTFSGKKGSSYVEKIGEDVANKGVIGLLVFKEKPKPNDYTIRSSGWDNNALLRGMTTTYNCSSSTMGGSSAIGGTLSSSSVSDIETASNIETSLGTEFGAATDFNTINVSFEKGDQLTMMEIYYGDAQFLKKKGISVSDYDKVMPRPQAFPKIGCKIPDGWGKG